MGISSSDTVKNQKNSNDFILKLKDNLDHKDVKAFITELAIIKKDGLNQENMKSLKLILGKCKNPN